MNWALLFAHWMEYGEPWSTPMSWVNELRARGHKVNIYNLYHANGQLHPKRRIRDYSNEGLNTMVADIRKGIPIDIVYILDYGPYQSLLLNKLNFPNQILIKEAGDEPQSHAMHLQTAAQFDIVLSPDWPSVQHYQQLGINAKWQTHFADERIFKNYPDVLVPFECVTTCGPRGNGLTDKIQAALGNKFNNERYFFGVDHAKRLNMGKMVFQKSQHGEITRRIFEGMACGRLMITDRLPEYTRLQELFIDGEDIIYYNDADDAIDKIKYYSEHTGELSRIASNGYAKVMQFHTAKARVDELETFINDKLKT